MYAYRQDPYPELRDTLALPLRRASPEQIEAMLARYGLEAEDVEDFMGFLRNAGQSISQALPGIGQTIATYAPGVIQGAAGGAATGATFGPWGALIGALGGGTLGAIQQAGQRPGAGPAPAAPPPPPMAPPAMPSMPAMPSPGGSPAAGQLLSLLARPEILQALMSLMLGRGGSPSVSVGGTQIPVGAVANLVGTLAQQAAAEATAIYPTAFGPAEYLRYAGEGVDTTEPEGRAYAALRAFSDAVHLEALADRNAERSEAFVPAAWEGITPEEFPELDPDFEPELFAYGEDR